MSEFAQRQWQNVGRLVVSVKGADGQREYRNIARIVTNGQWTRWYFTKDVDVNLFNWLKEQEFARNRNVTFKYVTEEETRARFAGGGHVRYQSSPPTGFPPAPQAPPTAHVSLPPAPYRPAPPPPQPPVAPTQRQSRPVPTAVTPDALMSSFLGASPPAPAGFTQSPDDDEIPF